MKANDSNRWLILERLADPATPATEREQLLVEIRKNPDLAALFQAYCSLSEWGSLERATLSRGPSPKLLDCLEREQAVEILDREITRLFPWVAAAALAAAVILAWMNIGNMGGAYRHPLEAIFGLPPTTLEDSLIVNL